MFDILKRRLKNVCYTSKHWFYYQKIAINLNVWRPRHLLHDVDKLFLYFIYEKNIVSDIHRITNKHHIEYMYANYTIDNIPESCIIDAIIDWECARYTKKDKPLNARQTLSTYYSIFYDVFIPILDKLNL